MRTQKAAHSQTTMLSISKGYRCRRESKFWAHPRNLLAWRVSCSLCGVLHGYWF